MAAGDGFKRSTPEIKPREVDQKAFSEKERKEAVFYSFAAKGS